MDNQNEQFFCGDHCRAIFVAVQEVERTQLAAKLAKDKLYALATSKGKNNPREPVQDSKPKTPAAGKKQPATDPFKGRRGGNWRDVPVTLVLRNIRGDMSPGALCTQLKITGSVLRSRVADIIGNPDKGKRWMAGIGYLIKGKPAWDREQNRLRVDKTKGAVMAVVSSAGAKPQSQASAGPTDEELSAFVAGKLTAAKLMQKYNCGKGKIYRAIQHYKVRFGADAPHGEPRHAGDSSSSNGVKKGSTNGVRSHAVLGAA